MASNKLKFRILPGEHWWGGSISNAWKLPITRAKVFNHSNEVNSTYNQSVPFYLSDKGRYIYSNSGFLIKSTFGFVTCTSDRDEIILSDGHKTLRGAYMAAQAAHFPPDGKMPHELMFTSPQYCTWIELLTDQTQEGILTYAQSIIDAGMPVGELLIDDGWQTGFGDWTFHKDKFSDPKAMIDKLHEMGFKVILWICPFVSEKYCDVLVERDCLVTDNSGKLAMRTWWNGVDAVLDLSNPKAMKWFTDTADRLINDYNIDGFKQDAGDGFYYCDNDITYGNVTANDQTMLWMESARQYPFNELRAAFKGGGYGIAQRLCDRAHKWNEVLGLRALVPYATLHGIVGYPFTCPDMIGGGQAGDFRTKDESSFDHDLFIRWSQASALMPMMQYSFALWKLKNKETATLCRDACGIHAQFQDYILEYARAAAVTGEPIIRSMEYEFPLQGFAKVKQQFMLGRDYLVAPVVTKGCIQHKIKLPHGKWEFLHNGDIINGGKTITITVPISVLPVFKRL